MSYNTDLVDQYYAFSKTKFGFLERIELVQNVDPQFWHGFQLIVVLRSEADSASPGLRLVFNGVKEFRTGELVGLLFYTVEIICIEEFQLENIRFKVTESENDAFSFVCDSFTFAIE